MAETGSKTSVAITFIAAAAALAVVSSLYWWRMRTGAADRTDLRDVRDILDECRVRMRDLQTQLSSADASSA